MMAFWWADLLAAAFVIGAVVGWCVLEIWDICREWLS